MKKPALPVAVLLFGFVGVGLSGCPIYDHEEAGCYDTSDCAHGYICDPYHGVCTVDFDEALRCREPRDCGVNETCDRFGTCSIGDCSFSSVGCVSGYECSREQGTWECIPDGGGAGGYSGEGASGGAGESPQGGASSGSGGAPDAAGSPGSGGNAAQAGGGRGLGGAGAGGA